MSRDNVRDVALCGCAGTTGATSRSMLDVIVDAVSRWWLLSLFVVACGDDAITPVDATNADTTFLDANVPMVELSGTTHAYDTTKVFDPAVQPRLGGVEVCDRTTAPMSCTTSDAQGRYTLSVRANSKPLRLSFASAGHVATHFVTFTDDVDRTDFFVFMFPDALVSSFYTACDAAATFPEVAASGILLVGSRFTPPNFAALEGGTMQLVDPPTGSVGPCYQDQIFTYDPQQLTTRASGQGVGVFANVPVESGHVDVDVKLAGSTCYSFRNVADTTTPDRIRVPLLAGHQTVLQVVCE
jgi:hypothetical protein